ncbi:MAG TPA: hypothetical protein V6C78_08670 [Crinalium sp.]|jgi:hypothetical protein
MLISSSITQFPTVQKLVTIWVDRYKPQLPFHAQRSSVFDSLVYAASPDGRQETVAKLHRSLIKLNCEYAEAQTRKLHEYASSATNGNETKHILQCTVEIYATLLEFYAQSTYTPDQALQSSKDVANLAAAGLNILDVVELASLLEPLLLEYQERHQISDDWAKIGFLTTHLNFANVALLNNLTTIERIFLKPYFNFIEEQVALPWQRICAAASTHQFNSPAFQLVNHMLPRADEIAHRVYTGLVRQFPRLTMRRGRLDHPGVQHSCLRDLNMFQAYLWLCMLEGSLAPVEDELVRLCTMVMPRVGVPWEMIVQWNQLLMAGIMEQSLLGQQSFLEPYTSGFIRAFQQSQDHFVTDAYLDHSLTHRLTHQLNPQRNITE